MAAYGSIASLLHILDQALKSDRPDWINHCEKQQLDSLYQKLESLQSIFDNFSTRMIHGDQAAMESLEGQIRDAVMKAEDVIEIQIADWRQQENKNIFLRWLREAVTSFIFHHRVNKLTEEIDLLMAQLSDFVLTTNRSPNKQSMLVSPAGPSRSVSHLHDDVVVGFDQEIESLKSRLLSNSKELQVVAIEGIGGIGKTTLARKLYEDHRITQHFDIRAWATVSQKFSLAELLCNLLSCAGIESMSCSELAEKLQKSLKGPRYLIVLDDIWEMDAWEQLMNCFPSEYNNGSRILITTRNFHVANQICGELLTHRLPLLKTEESWNLLCEKVFLGKVCPPELYEIGMEIAKRCGGLRLAIVVIAGFLSKIDPSKGEWHEVAENLNSIITNDAEGCMSVLALSYQNLPHHLKSCFLYMGIFPEDFEIPKWKLIRLWVAEGFLKMEKDELQEEAAEKCLKELVDRNLILIGKKGRCDGKIKTCKMHDILRDFSFRGAIKEKLVKIFLKPADSSNIQSTERSPRWLVGFEFPENVFMHLTRSITSYSEVINLGSDFSYRLLRVLNLKLPADEYSTKCLKKLVNLRYLHLKSVREFPDSITELLDLQILIFDFPRRGIEVGQWWKMSRLRHLCVPDSGDRGRSVVLPSPPNESEEDKSWVLGNLQTLHGLHPSSCNQQVFQRIPNVKSLTIRRAPAHACLKSIGLLLNLEYLKLAFFPYDAKVPFQPRLPPSLSQKLNKITLSECMLPWEDMSVLGMLPNLEVLKLKLHAFKGDVWEPTAGGFAGLKFLLLRRTFPSKDWVGVDSEAPFPRLEQLVLQYCKETEAKIPRSIGDIQTLQRIELQRCQQSIVDSAELIQQDRQEMGDDDLQLVIKNSIWY